MHKDELKLRTLIREVIREQSKGSNSGGTDGDLEGYVGSQGVAARVPRTQIGAMIKNLTNQINALRSKGTDPNVASEREELQAQVAELEKERDTTVA